MKERKPALSFVFVTLLLDVLGLGLIIPVLPKLIESFSNNDLQAASSTYGIMVAVFALMQFLFSPILGSLSDRFGRRPIILISLFGAGLDYLLLAFAPSLVWLFIGRIIAGITSANITTINAYIADISTPEKRAQNFGLIGAAFGLGFILGPLLGGVLGSFGIRVPFMVVAGITLVNWLYGFFVLPESLPKDNRRPYSWARANPIGSLVALGRYPVVKSLTSTFAFISLAQTMMYSVWALYTAYRYNWGTAEVGYSLAMVGLSAGLVQGGLIRRIVPKLGERRSVIVGLSVSAFSFVLYGLAPQGWMFYLIPLIGAFGGIAQPSAQAIISKNISPNEQGAVQGALASLNSLISIIAPIIGTNVFAYSISHAETITLPGVVFLLGSFFLLVAIAFAINTFRTLPDVKPGGNPITMQGAPGH
jgi:DHA1 family tetracycline resistance protein-like MFS transporter